MKGMNKKSAKMKKSDSLGGIHNFKRWNKNMCLSDIFKKEICQLIDEKH